MSTEQLYDKLKLVGPSRESRFQGANLILNQQELVPELLEILFKTEDEVSCKAAWILEFACGMQLSMLLPHLNTFTLKLPKVHLDSSVRSVAKICEYLAKACYIKKDQDITRELTPEYKNRIIEVCFDYLLQDKKTAPKAYAMTTLYLLGRDMNWIHPELKLILERDFPTQSAGFKARAKPILKQLKQL